VIRDGRTTAAAQASGITFAYDSAAVQPQFQPTLTRSPRPSPISKTYIDIYGHTDSDGSDAYNQGLSRTARRNRSPIISRPMGFSRHGWRRRFRRDPADRRQPQPKSGQGRQRRVEIRSCPGPRPTSRRLTRAKGSGALTAGGAGKDDAPPRPSEFRADPVDHHEPQRGDPARGGKPPGGVDPDKRGGKGEPTAAGIVPLKVRGRSDPRLMQAATSVLRSSTGDRHRPDAAGQRSDRAHMADPPRRWRHRRRSCSCPLPRPERG